MNEFLFLVIHRTKVDAITARSAIRMTLHYLSSDRDLFGQVVRGVPGMRDVVEWAGPGQSSVESLAELRRALRRLCGSERLAAVLIQMLAKHIWDAAEIDVAPLLGLAPRGVTPTPRVEAGESLGRAVSSRSAG